jgi:hypothetical protein
MTTEKSQTHHWVDQSLLTLSSLDAFSSRPSIPFILYPTQHISKPLTMDSDETSFQTVSVCSPTSASDE